MKNDTIKKITDFLFINKDFEELDNYDLVIVLGNNFYEKNAQFIKRLFDAKKINKNTTIILSGSKGSINSDIEKSEAQLIYEKIQELNLALECIIEPNATNIKENLLFSKKIINSFGQYNKILLVGKAFASRRILMCADALDFPLEKIDIFGLEEDVCKDTWYQNKEAKTRVLAELERIGKYASNGDLKI